MIIGYEKSKEKSQRKKVFRIEKVVEMKIMDPILFIDDNLNLNDIILYMFTCIAEIKIIQ